jgi:hypothetical protein
MKPSSLNTIVTALVGAAMLCGCASNSPTTPIASLASASASASASPTTRLPRDPVIDAYDGAMRADLSDGKIEIINSVMHLGDAEAKVFWPIYQDYESESFDLGDQRVELIRRFAAAQTSGKLEPRDATELADAYFRFQQQQLDLLKKYHGVITTELSPVRAAQFTQIEHRVGTVIDLSIAAEMPLIQTPSAAPSR